ncbi:YdiK family protein [Bacillus sp. SCS-153A]|uniref:YdiK family protein n=1 Tax=Rossellomorea sedimentorum TaxID=3115294 RepID=UPI0039060A12
MRRSPLFSGILYILLGVLFTYFAIRNVNDHGWGFFSYLMVLLATLDFVSGFRMVAMHFKIKKHMDNKK